jgi:GntR family transcriptional regulator/MocR family aminotransferase
VLPEDLVAVAAAVRRSIDISPPTFPQAILARFVREGHFGRHLRRMRALYRERRDALVAALRAELGPEAPIRGESAGMHLVLELPRGTNDREVAARMAGAGLWTMPLSFCRTRRSGAPGLVLGYGGCEAGELRDGARRLAQILAVG